MTTITVANTEQPAFNSTTNMTLTRINGRPLRCDRDTSNKEIEHVLVDISIPCFDWSGQYGRIVEVRTKSNYQIITSLNYLDTGPDKPPMTDPTIKETTFDSEKEKRKYNGMDSVPPGT